MDTHESSINALRNTDISFFGPLFDFNLRKLRDSQPDHGPQNDLTAEALVLTLADPILIHTTIGDIEKAVLSGACGTTYFSEESHKGLKLWRETLDRQSTTKPT